MIRKTYQAITSCAMTINIPKEDKTNVTINFSGHNIELGIKGKFSTNDPDIIEALESNSSFNHNYKLVATLEEKSESKVKASDLNPQINLDDLTPVGGFITVQAAKAYLIETFQDKITPSTLTTWKAIDETAAANGIKFVR